MSVLRPDRAYALRAFAFLPSLQLPEAFGPLAFFLLQSRPSPSVSARRDSVTDTICDTILEVDLKKGFRVSVVFALGSFVSAILALKLAFFVLGLMLRVGILATFWAVFQSLALLLVSVAGSFWGIFRTVYDTDAERDTYERHL